METTALLRSLLLLLLVTFSCSQTHGPDFPQVDPDRQQHFEGDTLTVSCEGLNGLMGWRVMKIIKGNAGPCAANWEISTGSCTVEGAAAEYDSGEYWCEMGGQQRSNSVNVTVTGGSVVLESPVHPVMQGDNVTLSCRTKETSSSFMAEFYKDGVSIGKSSTGTITFHSRFDEGFYKCSISDVGESPQSWLSVISEGASPPHRNPRQLFLLLSFRGSVFLVLLLLLGFLLYQTHRPAARGQTQGAASTRVSSVQSYSSPPTDEEHQPESSSAEAMYTTYATVTRPREVKEPEASSYSAPWIDMRHFYHTID